MRFHRLALLFAAFLSANNNLGGVYADEVGETIPNDLESYTPPDGAESFGFEAEVSKMLDIVVNSLYQNKDVFLRELISNASDALDKIRFLGIKNPDWLSAKPELEVKVEYDEDENTLTVTDSGIGMTHDDLVQNLGTVARSGTSKFLEAMKEGSGDLNMIGKFGVGFYSSFLVAERVRVATKHPSEDKQYVWESVNGESNFHIYEDPRGTSLGRGTEITLYLKDDASEYLQATRLKELTKHYSEFVTHPIQLRTVTKSMVPVEKETEDEEPADESDSDELDIEDDAEEEETEPEMEEITSYSWERVNTNQPIWTRDKDDITDDEYQQFYQAIIKSEEETAATWTHFSAEGNINFQALLYMPDELPEYLKYNLQHPEESGLSLYVRKVLISDTFDLMPRYLSFIKGVVDSDDLPLNVNRETLQESKILKIISKKLIRKSIEMLRHLAEKPAEEEKEVELDEDGNIVDGDDLDTDDSVEAIHPYIRWYMKFGTSLKMGCLEDQANQAKLMKLLRFKSSMYHGEMDWVSFADYIERMPEWQKEIYYIPAETIKEANSSNFMEKFKKKGVEVFYFTDPVDEYMLSQVREFDGKKFISIADEGITFDDEDKDLQKRREKAYKKKFKPLTSFLKKTFGSEVTKVVVSERLESTPAMISSTKYSHSANMERIMKAQAFQHGVDNDERTKAQRVFEINPRHPFVTKLLDLIPDDDDDETVVDSVTMDAIWLLHDVALLNSGFTISNTMKFSKRMTRVLKNQLTIESLELEDEIDLPDEEDDEPDEFDMDSEGMNMDDFEFNLNDLGDDLN